MQAEGPRDAEKLNMESAIPGQIVYYESPCDYDTRYGRILSIPDDRSGFHAEWYPSYGGYNGTYHQSEYGFKLKGGRFYPTVFVADEAELKQWEESIRKSCERRRAELSPLLTDYNDGSWVKGIIQITQDQAMDICRALYLAYHSGQVGYLGLSTDTENSVEMDLRTIDLLKKLATCYPHVKSTPIYEIMEV